MKAKLKPIQEQVVVLVGATSGIGLETAMHMAEKGASVVIVGRSQEGLADAVTRTQARAEAGRMARMRGSNGGTFGSQFGDFAGIESGEAPVTEMTEQVISLEGDITKFEDMRAVAEQVIHRFGRIDTWVNVAAVSEWALFEDTSPDEFRRIIEVNLVGHAFAAMAALPYLRQQLGGGSLIFVSSIAGRVPIPYQSAYNASKHGLIGLVDTLRQELKHTGAPVSVTTILPASINTPLFDKARTKIGVEPDPLPPIYDAKMVARAIAYAASHRVLELIVGDAGHMITFMRRLAPTLTSNYMGASGFRKQRSNEPKSAQAPDNLYQHISGYNQAEGDYREREMRFAPLTYLSTRPKVRMAVWGTLLVALGAFVGWRIVQERSYRRSWRYQLPRRASSFIKKAAGATMNARKSTANVLHRAGNAISGMPGVSDLPMFHKRTFFERFGDTMTGVWAALLAMLPFRRSKSLARRISEHMPEPRKVQKTLDKQRKVVTERISEASDKVREGITARGKEASKAVDKAVDKAARASKEAAPKAPRVERHDKVVERVTIRRR